MRKKKKTVLTAAPEKERQFRICLPNMSGGSLSHLNLQLKCTEISVAR